MNSFLRYIVNQSIRKRIDEKKLIIAHISLHPDDISYFALSSNPIISFAYDGKLYYFRECPKVSKFKEYYKIAVNRFFTIISRASFNTDNFKQKIPIRVQFSEKEISDFKEYLDTKQKENNYISRIYKTDVIFRKINFSIWNYEPFEMEFFEYFAINDIPLSCKDIGIYFLWYIRNACFSYKTMNIVKSKEYSYFSAIKSISSKIVAESIGLEHMIVSSKFCFIEISSGETLFGIISEAAIGKRKLDINIENEMYGSFQRELLNLNLLDLICFQPDHGPNNYNVYIDKDKCLVCAFDNDNTNTFMPILSIKHNFLGCSTIVKDKCLNRPYVDKTLVDNIDNLDIKTLNYQLKTYLNYIQIKAINVRLKKLKKLLHESIKRNPDILLEDKEWNISTSKKEKEYSPTYFTIAMKKSDFVR